MPLEAIFGLEREGRLAPLFSGQRVEQRRGRLGHAGGQMRQGGGRGKDQDRGKKQFSHGVQHSKYSSGPEPQ
jgi:hypothetical protein